MKSSTTLGLCIAHDATANIETNRTRARFETTPGMMPTRDDPAAEIDPKVLIAHRRFRRTGRVALFSSPPSSRELSMVRHG